MATILSKQNYDPARALDKVQVLVVNQSAEVARLLKNILVALGFRQSFTAEDAVEAVRYLREMRINILITDSRLRATSSEFAAPGQAGRTLCGAEFVRSLRQSRTSPNPYIAAVLLAQGMSEDELIKARDCGVNGVVLRPLEAEQLCLSIREIVASPRRFVVSEGYKGPCRRKRELPFALPDRRKRDVCIVKNNG